MSPISSKTLLAFFLLTLSSTSAFAPAVSSGRTVSSLSVGYVPDGLTAQQFEQFKKETPDDHAAALRLAAANAPPTIKARLKWAATVIPYNQKLDELRNAAASNDTVRRV